MPHIQTRKLFLINHKTMKRRCIGGLKKSPYKSTHKSLREKFQHHTIYSPDELPPKVDLRRWMTPVEDQSEINACTANAIAGLYEYLINKTTNQPLDVSRLFIYYNARKKDKEYDNLPTILTDEGASVIATIDACKEIGTCPEDKWPYIKAIVNVKPSKESKKEARAFTIVGAMRIPVDLYYMKSCLAQGFPFIFGLQLYASFDKAATNNGVVPMPKSSMAARAAHGNHAMLAVGYSEASQAFIIRNSWGEEWGDKGYCYIPYEYMTNKELCSELWTVRNSSTYALGTEHWVRQDTVNYLAHNSAFGPKAYTDDDDWLSIEYIIVRDRVCSSKYCPGLPVTNYVAPPIPTYSLPPVASYDPPPVADYAPPPADYAAPPVADYAPPPVAYYAPPPVTDYAPPPVAYYAPPPVADYAPPPVAYYPPPPIASYVPPPVAYYAPPPVMNYPMPSMMNYGSASMANYAMPAITNYAALPIPNYPISPLAIYGGSQNSPFGIPPHGFGIPPTIWSPPRILVPPPTPRWPPRRVPPLPPPVSNCNANQNRPRSLWRRIFLKP